MPTMILRVLSFVLVLLAAASVPATALAAADPATAADSAPTSEAALEGKALREAIKALDRSDPAVAYARGLQREGYGLLVGGGVIMLGVMVAAAGTARAGGDTAARGASATGLLMPLGIGVAVAGVPGLLSGHRYLSWYATNRKPPSELARLKLMNHWRRQYLQIQRNTGLLGSAFAGAATLVAAIGWAVDDRVGLNGTPGTETYNPSGALTTLGFGLLTSGLAATGLVAELRLKRDPIGAHPALASLRVAPGHLTVRF